MYYNKIYFNSDVMNADVLNGIQDDIINIIIPHLAEYGFEFTFEKHTYAVNEFPLISNISAIENIIDEMGQAIDYTIDNDNYKWIEKKDWTVDGKKLFGAEDLNRWCNNLVFLGAYEKPITYHWVEYATPTQIDSATIKNTSIIINDADKIHEMAKSNSTLISGIETTYPKKYDKTQNTISIINNNKVSSSNNLCIAYGSYIYVFGGIKSVYKTTGTYTDVNSQCYYKFNTTTNEWVMENKSIKKYSCPYTFQYNCCDVIYYNDKIIFAYTVIDEDNIPIYDDRGNATYVYSITDTGKLKFIEFDPSNETWTEKDWGNWSIYRSIYSDCSYNKMVKAPNNVIYFATTRMINNEKEYWLYKIENNTVNVVKTDLPGGVSKMFSYENNLYMICNKSNEFYDAVYKYNTITGETTLMYNDTNVFGDGTKYTTSFYFEDGYLYKIKNSKIYRLERE